MSFHSFELGGAMTKRFHFYAGFPTVLVWCYDFSAAFHNNTKTESFPKLYK